jgi:hypothetical protein
MSIDKINYQLSVNSYQCEEMKGKKELKAQGSKLKAGCRRRRGFRLR